MDFCHGIMGYLFLEPTFPSVLDSDSKTWALGKGYDLIRVTSLSLLIILDSSDYMNWYYPCWLPTYFLLGKPRSNE